MKGGILIFILFFAEEPNATIAPMPEVIGVSSLGGVDTKSHGQLYLVLGAVIAGLTLLLTLAIAICICYKRSAPHDDQGSCKHFPYASMYLRRESAFCLYITSHFFPTH
jgi:hypothetical protein